MCRVVQYFTEYGPSFDLDVTPSYVRNLNTEAYTESVVLAVLSTFMTLFHCNLYNKRNLVCMSVCLPVSVCVCPD